MSLSEGQTRLLVSGYIGDTMKQFDLIFPSELIEIIFILYYIVSLQDLCYDMNDEWDKWDDKTKHDAYKIMDNTKIIARINLELVPFTICEKITDSGISIWRLRIIKCFMYRIGFYPSCRIKKHVCDYSFLNDKETLFIYNSGSIGTRNAKYQCNHSDSYTPQFENENDIICIILYATSKL